MTFELCFPTEKSKIDNVKVVANFIRLTVDAITQYASLVLFPLIVLSSIATGFCQVIL